MRLINHTLLIISLLTCYTNTSYGQAAFPSTPTGNECSGFSITNFEQSHPFLYIVGEQDETYFDSGKLMLNSSGVTWRECRFGVATGFEVSVEFQTTSVLQDGSLGLNAAPDGVGVGYRIETGDDGKPVVVFNEFFNSVRLPLNVFDGKRHKVTFKLIPVSAKSGMIDYAASVLIDDLPEIKARQRIAYAASQSFIRPDISGPRGTLFTVYAWAFKNNTGGRILQSSDCEQLSGDFTFNGTRYKVRNSLEKADRIGGFANEREDENGSAFRLAPERHGGQKPEVIFRKVNRETQHGIVLIGEGEIYVGDVCIDLNRQNCDRISAESRPNTGNVLVTDVIRFDGTKGRLITVTDVKMGRSTMTDNQPLYSLSGHFYIWDEQPLTEKIPAITTLPKSKLVSFCGGKYNLQDKFAGEMAHYYENVRVICNTKNNPYCTVSNVFSHMMSNVDYMAPASVRSVINPDLSFLDGVALLPVGYDIEKARSSEVVLEHRNQGNRVCNCEEVSLIGFSDLLTLEGFKLLDPSVKNDTYKVLRNPIITTVDQQQFTAINRTLEGHNFHPGKVTRSVYEKDGQVIVKTEGTGMTSLKETNNTMGLLIFERINNNLWLDFNIIARSPQLQKQVKDQPCPQQTKALPIKAQSVKKK